MKTITVMVCLSGLCLCEGSGLDRMRLQDVTAVTLHAGKMTKGKRADPVPQIECVGWCPIPEPRTATCVNRGFDGYTIQWECNADLEDGFEFDNMDVLCEGYDYSNDPYIFEGSCGLKYTLRTSSNTKNTSYTYKGTATGTQEMPSRIKGLILALHKTYLSPVINFTRTDRSSSNNHYPDDGTSEPRMGRSIVGFGGVDAGGCTGCTNCINCPNSTGCRNCSNCSNCTGCENCYNCSNCNGCSGCSNCSNCTGCQNCNNCNNCNNCKNDSRPRDVPE